MNHAVIVGYARSPFHFAAKGALARTRADDLAAAVVKGMVSKSGIDPNDLEDLLLGCAFPEGEQGLNVARLVSFIAGLPVLRLLHAGHSFSGGRDCHGSGRRLCLRRG